MNKSTGVPRLCQTLFFSVMLFAGAGFAHAQVDQSELEKNLPPVTFINYEGPQARVETREQIRQIGAALGRAVQGGAAQAGTNGRYFVLHSVSDPDGGKLDADIFGLGVDAGVDHIRNLRTIIQGYLQEAYGYTASDAALLAEYVTVYNAVYRGDWDYFTGRYKAPVLDNLTREKAGLSIRFDEWPGRTLMLIPLGIGGLSAVDTTTVSDSRVIEELRKDDDMGVEQRRDMVDLKEREAAAAEQRAADTRQAVQEEERRIAEERARLDQEKQQIAEERQAAEGDAEKQAELDRREAEADQKAEELNQQEERLEVQREAAQQQEDFAERKTAEAQAEREGIAQDQQSLINQGGGPAPGVIGVALSGADAVMGSLVQLNPATGGVLKRSPLDTVYARSLVFAGGKLLAIAGENRGNGAVRLIEIHTGSLEMVQQGSDDIHPGSLIWVNGGDLYAITVNLANGTLNLARFNTDLVLQARSSIAVHRNAAVIVQQGSLLTQRADGSAALLNPANLTEVGR